MLFFLLACTGGADDSDSALDTAGVDSADTAHTGDTSDSGDTAHTGETGDTSDTGTDDLCDQSFSTSPPAGPDCLTASLTCGQTLEATTEGGAGDYVAADYTHLFCFVPSAVNTYTGTERAYRVELDPDVAGTLTLEAPCATMGVAAMRWDDAETCPTSDDSVTVCEGRTGTGTVTVDFGGFPTVNSWVIVVDSEGADPAPFRLTLDCG